MRYNTEAEEIEALKNLHREFVDTMYPKFGLPNPLYVENIQFKPRLSYGGYGIDKNGQPLIYLNDIYLFTHSQKCI